MENNTNEDLLDILLRPTIDLRPFTFEHHTPSPTAPLTFHRRPRSMCLVKPVGLRGFGEDRQRHGDQPRPGARRFDRSNGPKK